MSIENRNWYVVNTYAGHENVVKERLIKRIESYSLQDFVFRVLVAEKEIKEFRKGKEVIKKENLFKGYLFIEMDMTDEAWFIVRNTPGVTGFIGSSGGGAKPFPVDDEEMLKLLKTFDNQSSDTKEFKINEKVIILNDNYKNVEGVISAIDKENVFATVDIIFFGRTQSVDVKLYDLQKVTKK